MAPRYRLGVDVGGTHTDLVLLDAAGGALAVEKVSTTPKNPALGVMNGIEKFAARGIDLAAIEFFSHGTTITTNALLEMRGAKVGLLINRGFRAIQETQGQARDGNVFDYFFQKPEPIAPQSLTREIGGRIDYTGAELEPLDEDAVRKAAVELKAAGVSSIAVCYLFSFMNPAHEQRTGALIAEAFAEAHVSLSSEVLSRVREWPRMSATLLNAYLAPVLVTYIADLEKRLTGAGVLTQQRFLMQSNGGVMPFAAAITGHKTVQSLLSGPAAGAQASAYLPHEGMRGLVTLDMGGTSCDIAFIEGASPLEVTEGTVARRQLDVPALDLTTISAGGGSIVWIDRAGFLSVGPQSAGADPGPVCYGRGGENPTVTDADIVCGFLNPDYFLGGTQKLNAEAAYTALEEKIAGPLNMTVPEAAAGIRRIVDMRMADEVRVFAARRGVDLSEFALLPFGGAGAVHAGAVAEELGMRRIIVPARPGAFSALGLLCTDVLHDYIRSELGAFDRLDPAHAEEVFRDLEAKAVGELAEEGLGPSKAAFERDLDMRYAGQGYELRVPLSGLWQGAPDAKALAAVRRRFDEVHEKVHGHAAREKAVEVVSYRLRVRVAVPKYSPQAAEVRKPSSPALAALKGTRRVFFEPGKAVKTTVYDRDKLAIGTVFTGPAIIEQFDATTVVPHGWHVLVDRYGNLILERKDPDMVDAITTQIVRNRIGSLMQEMHYHFYRSGYSTIIRESRDFSCVILDRHGGLIVAPPMFFHAPVYRHLVAKILAVHGNDVADGDMFVCNHPYDGGLPHVSDMAFIAPIIFDGTLIGFAGSIAHKADVGGANPGSTSANATEIFQEGLLLPPVKIYARGVFIDDLERLILANSRQPELVRGDMHAQMAATRMGAERIKTTCRQFGVTTVMGAFAAILAGAAAELRAAISALPDGEASAEGFMDNDGVELDRPVRFAVTVRIEQDEITFDFRNADRQAKGPINLRPSMVEACVFYSLIGALDPKLHFNDGMREVVKFVYAPNTVTNASAPAPVSSYQAANLKLTDVILEALAPFRPERAVANGGASGAMLISWKEGGRPGQPSLQYEILGSAYGGGNGNDGASAVATHTSNLHITPIEILETEFPCRIVEFDMVQDSCGAGEFRGGLSFRRIYELLQDATVVRRYDRARFAPKGVAGGKPGSRSRFLIHLGTAEERETPASGKYELRAGERFLLQSAGGGGYGDPHKRDAAALELDIAQGYVSAASAERDYGKKD